MSAFATVAHPELSLPRPALMRAARAAGWLGVMSLTICAATLVGMALSVLGALGVLIVAALALVVVAAIGLVAAAALVVFAAVLIVAAVIALATGATATVVAGGLALCSWLGRWLAPAARLTARPTSGSSARCSAG